MNTASPSKSPTPATPGPPLRSASWGSLGRAAQSLWRRPGTPLTIVGLLGLALASTATLLTVVESYVLRPLPYPEADRLHSVLWETDDGERTPRSVDPELWTAPSTGVAAATVWDLDTFTMIGGTPELVPGAWVTPDFFQVSGVTVQRGRAFTRADVERGDRSLAVISHGLWQRRFGGREDVVGQTFEAFMSDRPDEAERFTVIGVLPEGFWWVNRYTDVLVPYAEGPVPRIVRLAPGASASQAATAFADLSRAADPTLPASFRVRLIPLQERYVAGVAPLLRGLILATGFVLLVACGNSLLLLLVRATRRERELAVHAALAGGWSGAARLLIAEAVLMTAAAGAAGLLLAGAALRGLAPHLEQQLGRVPPGGPGAVALGPTALLGVGAVCLILAPLCAWLPLWLLRRRDLSSILRGAAASASGHRGARRTRTVLLGAEIAFTLALLVAGGLAVRSALGLEQLALGHVRQGVLLGGVGMRLGSYPGPAEQVDLARRLLERFRGVAGVERAAVAGGNVLGEMRPRSVVADRTSGGNEIRATTGVRSVSDGYFETLGIEPRAGRDFGAGDRIESTPVAIVSQELADRLWPDGGAIGRRLRLEEPADGRMVMHGSPDGEPEPWRTVVGVVAPVRETAVGEVLPELYLPLDQSPSRWLGVAVAASGDPMALAPSLTAALADVDPTLPLYAASTIDRRLAEERTPSRFLAVLLGAFSLFALALGTAGVYGVISHGVAQRLREIAIRRSLGADRGRILGLFLSETALLLLVGLSTGVGAGLLLVRSLATRLHGITGAGGLSTWLAVGALLTCSALLATWIPARRATGADPAPLLRAD